MSPTQGRGSHLLAAGDKPKPSYKSKLQRILQGLKQAA